MSDALRAVLSNALASARPASICVAFSGGPDSAALLHALAHLPDARARGLRALHVDHGLHPDSAAWAQRCATFCQVVDVPLVTVRVQVDQASGAGVEAAARHARYAAFAAQLHVGEWLALAHHRDDQVETVLLKLLRGAGPEGLGGMRTLRPFARGCLWRPLLETPRETLRKYLPDNHIDAIDDPANGDPRFARNVVRRELLPLLAAYWSQAEAAILHTARLCREAADHLDVEAQSALAALRREADTLDATGWLALPAALRAPVLDAWLHAQDLSHPPDASRAELARQAAHAADDSVPQVTWPGAEVRVWDGRLHATPPLVAPPANWHAAWTGTPLELPPDCGVLTLDGTATRFDPPLEVRLRRGGERIKPAGDTHTRDLRDLFQQARIPPWLRTRCPLVYAAGELVAVADLWCSAGGAMLFGTRGARPHWQRPRWAPSPVALSVGAR